jgi:tRNA threonylcarbamoyl adenosine modification protein (Sua5/YciO/YrdC/YwlC family)
MEIFTKEEALEYKEKLKKEILKGAIFIYPTDTIYGIGCNALNNKAVEKIRELKSRATNPFSIIAPGKKWIKDNCIINDENWLNNLPGPYTLVMEMKNKKAVSSHVNPGIKTLGVRIPNNWFSKIVEEIGVPVVTTSVNKTGEPYMTSLEDVDDDIKHAVDYIFYEGERDGKPSTLVIFNKGKVEVKER